jgi:hypothetical protein
MLTRIVLQRRHVRAMERPVEDSLARNNDVMERDILVNWERGEDSGNASS